MNEDVIQKLAKVLPHSEWLEIRDSMRDHTTQGLLWLCLKYSIQAKELKELLMNQQGQHKVTENTLHTLLIELEMRVTFLKCKKSFFKKHCYHCSMLNLIKEYKTCLS